MMDNADLDAKWEQFINDEGSAVEKEIYQSLQDTAHVFDVADGTHAKWANDGILGLLLVFSEEEADILLAAFHAGVEGIEDATYAWGVWVTSLMGMIRQCMQGAAENN
jgi:hypothetical protein